MTFESCLKVPLVPRSRVISAKDSPGDGLMATSPCYELAGIPCDNRTGVMFLETKLLSSCALLALRPLGLRKSLDGDSSHGVLASSGLLTISVEFNLFSSMLQKLRRIFHRSTKVLCSSGRVLGRFLMLSD